MSSYQNCNVEVIKVKRISVTFSTSFNFFIRPGEVRFIGQVSVDQIGADVSTRRPSNPLLALRFRTAVRAFGKSHLATGTFIWLQLPLSQGISKDSSIPWTPFHHLRAREGCWGVSFVGTKLIDSTVPSPLKGKTRTVAFSPPVEAI